MSSVKALESRLTDYVWLLIEDNTLYPHPFECVPFSRVSSESGHIMPLGLVIS